MERDRHPLTLIALAALPAAVLGMFFVLPVGAMIHRGLWSDGGLDVSGAWEVLTRERTLRVLRFTLLSATAGSVVCLVLGLPCTWVLHRLAFPGRDLIRALLLVPFVLPTVVVGVAFRLLFSAQGPLGFLSWDGSAWAIIAALAFFNISVVIKMVGASWESLDPRPAEAAAALGAGPWRVLCSVTWPQLRGSIAAATSVVFLFCATAFGVVLTMGGLRYATIETEIWLLTTNLFDLQAAAVLSVLQVLVVALLLVVTQRLRTIDPTVSRVRSVPRRVRRNDLPLVGFTVVVLAAVALPLVTMVVTSLRRDGSWTLAYYRGLGDSVGDAVAVSLRTAVDATWMSLLLGLLVAFALTRPVWSRSQRWVQGGLGALVMLPLGVSAVTLGFGLLITLDTPPIDWRDNPLLVPLAQALVALPLVVRTLVPVLTGIDDRQRQVARSLGAGAWRVLVTVEVPVLITPIVTAAGFAFAVSLGEFGATSFLVRESSPTLPVLISHLVGRPGDLNFGMALAASTILGGLAATLMLVTEHIGGRAVRSGA